MTLQNYATDSYQSGGRGSPNAWSPSSDGQNYSQAAGAATMSIISAGGRSRGKLTNDTTANVIFLGSRQFTDMDQYIRVNVSNTAIIASLVGRATASNTYYRADFTGTTFEIVVNNSGTTTQLAHTTISSTASTYYWLHFRVQGFGSPGSNPNNLKANFWADPTSGSSTGPTGEPAGWMIQASDGSITNPGNFGVHYKATATGQSATYDAYTVTDCPAPATLPAYNTVGDRPYGTTLFTSTSNPSPIVTQQILDMVGPNPVSSIGLGNGSWIRYQWHWSVGEPIQGYYDWAILDAAVQQCNYSGIRILLPLQGAPSFRQTIDGLGNNCTLNATRNAGTAYTTLTVTALPSGAYLPHLYQLTVNYGGGTAETVYIWNPAATYTSGATSIGISTSKTSQVAWTPASTHNVGEPIYEATGGPALPSASDFATFAGLVAARYNGTAGYGKLDAMQVENEHYSLGPTQIGKQGPYNPGTNSGSPATWDKSCAWDNGGAILAPVYIACRNAIHAVSGMSNLPVFTCADCRARVTRRQCYFNWMSGLVQSVIALGGTLDGVDFHYYRVGVSNWDGTRSPDPTVSTFTDNTQTVVDMPAIAMLVSDFMSIFAANSISPLLICGETGHHIYDDQSGPFTNTTATYSTGNSYTALAVSGTWTNSASIPDATPVTVDYANIGVSEQVYAYGTTSANATSIPITTNPLGSGAAQAAWTPATTHSSGVQIYGFTGHPTPPANAATYLKSMYDAMRLGGGAKCFVYTIDSAATTVTNTIPPWSVRPDNVVQTISGTYTYEPAYSVVVSDAALYPTWASTPSTSYSQTIIKDGPVVYYRLDETTGTNTHDSSGNNFNGTIAGSGVTYSQPGAIAGDSDTAFLLDGAHGKVTLPGGGASPVGWKGITVEAWVNLTSNSFGNKATLFATGSTPTNSGDGFKCWIGANGVNGGLAIGVSGDRWAQATFAQTFTAGTWYHVAGTWDGTTVTLYVNGVQNGTTGSVTGAIDDTGFHIAIGEDPQAAGDWLPATIDETAVYSKALSATKIQAHYAAGIGQVATPSAFITNKPGTVLLLINDVHYPTIVQDGDAIIIDRTANDPIPVFSFMLQDDPSHIALQELEEVVFIDAGQIPNPSHNLLSNPAMNPYTTNWTKRSTQTGIAYSQNGSGGVVIAFTNAASGNFGHISQTTQGGDVVAGQSYMFSATVQGSGTPTNIYASLVINLLDQSGNTVSTYRYDGPAPVSTAPVQYSLQVSIPPGIAYIQARLTGTTTSSTNSGSITWTQAQLEPMSFTTGNYQLSYPTPWCASGQTNCFVLPDGTTIRQLRLFGGLITKATVDEHVGPNRKWKVTVSGYAWLLQKQILNDSWTATADSTIIGNIVSKYFSGVFSTAQVATGNTYQATLAYVYNGTARDAFDALAGNSNYIYYVDAYWTIWYQPPGYNTLPFELSDRPDEISSFEYYTYSNDIDGTQIGNNIYVTGATGVAAIVIDAQSVATYANRLKSSGAFWRQVNNSAIASNAAAISAGQGEAGQYGYARPILHCYTEQFMIPGYTVLFTSVTDGLIRAAFLVQKATLILKGFASLGSAVYECQCDLGYFNPDLTNVLSQILRQQTSATTGGQTSASYYGPVTPTTPVIDVMATETINFRDSVQVSITTPHTGQLTVPRSFGGTLILQVPAPILGVAGTWYGTAGAVYGSNLVGYS